MRHTDTGQDSNSRSNVHFSDDTIGNSRFDAGTGSDKNGSYGGVVIAIATGETIAVIHIVAFGSHIFGITFVTPNKVLQINPEFVQLPLKENIRRYVIALWGNDLKMSAEMKMLLDKINNAYPLDEEFI